MASDEDTCAVCHADRPGPKNPIIFCDGRDCNIPVHKRCYGVGAVPKGDWFCQRCECKLNKKPTNVICCPMQTGAFKYTVIPGGFMHVVCAMWNKKIDHTSEIYAVDKKDLNVEECDICHETTGLCIKCQHPACSSKFHVTCAIKADHLAPASSVADKFIFYCSDHQPPPRRTSKSNNTKTTRRTLSTTPRRRKRQDTTSDEEDSISDEEDDDDNADGDHANSDIDEDEEMGDDPEDDDHDDQGNDGNDEDNDNDDNDSDDDDDSDDDMGLSTRKRNKSKSSTTLSNKRRATTGPTQRKGPLRLFLDDQNSSDDDMGTTSSNTNKNKLSGHRQQQDSIDLDLRRESSPTSTSSVLSLPERLKAKRNKMEISSKPIPKQPTSPIIKKSPNLSANSPSLALNLNKPTSSSTFTSTSSSTSSSKASLSSIKSSSNPTNYSGSTTSSSGLQSDSSSTSGGGSSATSTSVPSPSQSTQQYLNGTVKQKLPNKAHLNNNTNITPPPSSSSSSSSTSSSLLLSAATSSSVSSAPSASSSSSSSSLKPSFSGNGIINGNTNHRLGNANPITTSSPMSSYSSATNSSIQSAKKLPGVNNNNTNNNSNSSSNSNNNNNNNSSSNRPSKVKDLDEIQNDIRAQKRQNSSGGMEMNNGNNNNGLYRMMDRKNSQTQPGFDMGQLNMMKTMIHEAVDTALAGRSAPPPIPVPDLTTIQQLQSKLQVAEREIARITNELRRASEFKKNVADIFEGLNIQPPSSSSSSSTHRSIPPGKMEMHVESLVADIKNMLVRSGPINDKERDRMTSFAEEIIKDGSF